MLTLPDQSKFASYTPATTGYYGFLLNWEYHLANQTGLAQTLAIPDDRMMYANCKQ